MREVLGPHRNFAPEGGDGVAPDYPAVSETDDLRIRDYLRIFVRRRWMIASLVAAGLLAGVVQNWRATPIFESRARLMIEGDANILGLERPVVDQRIWLGNFQPTQLSILESRSIAVRASEALSRTSPAGAHIPSVDEIRGGLVLSQQKDTRLVNVGFRSPDAALTARVANAVAQAYVEESDALRSTVVGQASDWLSQQVQEQRRLVQQSEAALQRYRQEHGSDVVGSRENDRRPSIVLQKLGDLQEAVTRARAETIEKEAQAAQLQSVEASDQALDTLPIIASNSFIQSLKGELAGLQQQLAQASEKLGERHPDIIKLRGGIENAERKLQLELSKATAAIRNDLDAARARERALSEALERQKAAAQDLNAKAVEYTALEREAEVNREQLDKMLVRSREAVLARDVPTANSRILDPAEVPFEPILPRKNRNLALGAVAGGALALALVFLLEIINNQVNSPDDVTRYLRLPVLGVTPQVKSLNGHSYPLLSEGAPPEFAELLHSVRTSLVMAPALAGGKTLLVTSSQSGEGKTVAAANLALSLARLNLRVLLIDADLRRPRLHEMFGVEQRPGLTDVLRGRATHSALHKTKVPRLWVMPSGLPSRNAADLLGSERFTQLIDCFREQFDWVVLDSPPVLAVTDACLMTRVASGVLFVVGSGKISRDVARAAVDRLDAVAANMVGALLNGADLRKGGESYLPYYHRDYQYYPTRASGYWLPEAPEATLQAEAESSHVAEHSTDAPAAKPVRQI